MFHFVLVFIDILYIFIKSSQSSAVLASFNETCSDNVSCVQPLVCSDTNRCLCSKSSSIWNENLKDCFYCPSDWIHWENNHCLSLAMMPDGGVNYQQAHETCQSVSAQLFYFYNFNQFKLFEYEIRNLLQSSYATSIDMFFRLGAWIDKNNKERSEDIWCDDSIVDPTFECIYIKKMNSKSDSLCLNKYKCDDEMPFLCDKMATSEKDTPMNGESDPSNQRFAQLLTALAPVALDVLNGLFGNRQTQPPPQPQQPQQIVIQQDPSAAALAGKSDNTMLYVTIGIVGLIFILFLCCIAGAVIYFAVSSKNPSPNAQSSTTSTYSAA